MKRKRGCFVFVLKDCGNAKGVSWIPREEIERVLSALPLPSEEGDLYEAYRAELLR